MDVGVLPSFGRVEEVIYELGQRSFESFLLMCLALTQDRYGVLPVRRGSHDLRKQDIKRKRAYTRIHRRIATTNTHRQCENTKRLEG